MDCQCQRGVATKSDPVHRAPRENSDKEKNRRCVGRLATVVIACVSCHGFCEEQSGSPSRFDVGQEGASREKQLLQDSDSNGTVASNGPRKFLWFQSPSGRRHSMESLPLESRGVDAPTIGVSSASRIAETASCEPEGSNRSQYKADIEVWNVAIEHVFSR